MDEFQPVQKVHTEILYALVHWFQKIYQQLHVANNDSVMFSCNIDVDDEVRKEPLSLQMHCMSQQQSSANIETPMASFLLLSQHCCCI